MTKRLQSLTASLKKKKDALDEKFNDYFDDIKRANGQPLNDKRNGQQTLNRWERKRRSLQNQAEEIEKTERAIEREQSTITGCQAAMREMPKAIQDAYNSGEITQWRKHPTVFFVPGVDKARLQWKNGKLVHRFAPHITCKEQYEKFRDVFNELNASTKNKG